MRSLISLARHLGAIGAVGLIFAASACSTCRTSPTAETCARAQQKSQAGEALTDEEQSCFSRGLASVRPTPSRPEGQTFTPIGSPGSAVGFGKPY